MFTKWDRITRLLSVALVASATVAAAAQSASPNSSDSPKQASVKHVSVNPYSRHLPVSRRARLYYDLGWGVDQLSAKSVESGELIRFSYHVIDAKKAAPLNDGKLEPFLLGERSHVKLVIPQLEKVGQLRNKNAAENGKSYWMAFSNKGGYVKKGDVVTVVIGKFRATGLIVQ